ncbi:MAG: hypothetical protein AB7O21_17730 [Gammaproteobacteria bacterium]
MNDDPLRAIIALHFDPEAGSPYWLRRQRTLGFDPRARIRAIDDLALFGPFDLEDLNRYPVTDFVPEAVRRCTRLVLAETGGTSGVPRTTAYSEEDFHAAFVAPFLDAVAAVPLDEGGQWLWVGPGGPHIIGKAAQRIAVLTTGCEAFSVDFDPRWFRRLAAGSLGRTRYLDHVLEQALRVIAAQDIRYLFSTPVVLEALATQMDPAARSRIRFLYLGGMPVGAGARAALAEAFPAARGLIGYGNTLFGVCHQHGGDPWHARVPEYRAPAPRLGVRIVPLAGADRDRLRARVAPGERGQVVMHRLDASGFLPCVFERDSAVRGELGASQDALLDPQPLHGPGFKPDSGIY